MTQELLIIDDDTELCDLLKQYLSTEGFNVTQIHDGQEGIDHLQALHAKQAIRYSAIILDSMLPGLQGLDILQRLRTFSSLPVLMLTAKGSDIDRIIGLESGADDYLPKPCNPRELLARLRAILRRSDKQPSSTASHYQLHGIELDSGSRTSIILGKKLDLTSAEFNTLLALISRPGKVVSKEDLTEIALNRKHTRYDRSIDVHISSIRKKIQAFIPKKEIIKTVRGSGYIFVDQLEA